MNRRIALVALAVVLGIVGAGSVYVYAQGANERAVESLEAVEVVVVKQSVPAGTSWTDAVDGEYLEVEKVPANAAPTSALDGLDAAVADADVSTHALRPGQVVTSTMFGEEAAATGPLELPGDRQAISIALEADAQVSGYVLAGSEVAIYQTAEVSGGPKVGDRQSTSGEEDKSFVTKLLLPRVSVLGVNRTATAEGDGNSQASNTQSSVQSGDSFLVTLAVTQREAERIILAQEVGALYLGLLTETSVTKPGKGVINRALLDPDVLYKD